MVGDHAYWVYRLKLRDPSANGAGNDPGGQIDAISRGFNFGDPIPSSTMYGVGSVPNGNLGTLTFTKQAKTWGAPIGAMRGDEIDLTATNIKSLSINVSRARVDCNVNLKITSDGPIAVTLPGCNRIVHGP